MPDFHEADSEIVYISGKQAEEIGFEKFHRRQTKLQGIHVLVLDYMRIQHRPSESSEEASISDLCSEITELDLTGNLFETLDEIVSLCGLLPKLRILTLNDNRFGVDPDHNYAMLRTIHSLNLASTLLQQAELNKLLSIFPSIEALTLAENEIREPPHMSMPPKLSLLDLSDNELTSLSDLRYLGTTNSRPRSLVLKRNRISTVTAQESTGFSLPVFELDLTYNDINRWSFFDNITTERFPNLTHLRITGNPLYKDLVSADAKRLTVEDGYMLTIARLPQLEYINYSKITEKERLNAETYYLGQIAIELSNVPEAKQEEVIVQHPRYRDLCDEYGEPTIQRRTRVENLDPNSLAARLVTLSFSLSPRILPSKQQRSWTEQVPKSFPIYSLLGIVGKRFGLMPLDLRLVMETNERDPLGRDRGYSGPEWWDSSDDEDDDEHDEWVQREVELVAGTRTIGTYIDGTSATVRVELSNSED